MSLLSRLDRLVPRRLRDLRVAAGAICVVLLASTIALTRASEEPEADSSLRTGGPAVTSSEVEGPQLHDDEAGGGPFALRDGEQGETADLPTQLPPAPEAGREEAGAVASPADPGADPGAPAGEGAAAPDPTAPEAAPSQPAPGGEGTAGGEPASPHEGPVVIGKGVGDTTINIGMTWFDATKIGPFFAAIGADASGIDFGDVKRQGEAVIDHVNAHGGLAGRQLEPVWYEQQSSEDVTEDGKARQAQAMCATFIEDSEVFAIVQGFQGHATFTACTAEGRTPLIATSNTFNVDAEWFSQISPYFYTVHGMLADRRERAFADGLVAQGFFTPGARVGLMTYDRPEVKRSVERVLKPRLAAHGIAVEVEALYPDSKQSPWPSYVLQFQSAGVTHILWSASDTFVAPVFFMGAAENQLYRPHYGIASDQGPSALTLAPDEQLRGVRGVGWLPSSDTGSDEIVSANDLRCRQIMRDAGEPEYPPGGRGYCEGLFFLKDALDSAARITPEGLSAAVEQLGDSHLSVYTSGTRFGPGRHDGADVVRDFAYDDSCRCFAYFGSARRVG